jgi:hypothetical protein
VDQPPAEVVARLGVEGFGQRAEVGVSHGDETLPVEVGEPRESIGGKNGPTISKRLRLVPQRLKRPVAGRP